MPRHPLRRKNIHRSKIKITERSVAAEEELTEEAAFQVFECG
jgi:hypothetical protein